MLSLDNLDLFHRRFDHNLVRVDLMPAHYVIEHGLYALYSYDAGIKKCEFRCRRVALAFDSEVLKYYRLGEPEAIMKWAANFKAELRERSEPRTAENVAVALLPSNHNVIELNKLLDNPDYVVIFLQKAGMI